MCGISEIRIDSKAISMFFGYTKSYININEVCFGRVEDDLSGTKEQIIGELSKFSKEQLIDIIVELAENGDEA